MKKNTVNEAISKLDTELLEEHFLQRAELEMARKRRAKTKIWIGSLSAAACLVIAVTVTLTSILPSLTDPNLGDPSDIGASSSTPPSGNEPPTDSGNDIVSGEIPGFEISGDNGDKSDEGVSGSAGDKGYPDIGVAGECGDKITVEDGYWYINGEKTDFRVEDGSISGDISGGSANAPKPTVGILTAGEWRDTDDLEAWVTLLNENNWYSIMEERELYSDHVHAVHVHDAEGNPCYNATVELTDESGAVIYRARTDVNGNAYLLSELTGKGAKAAGVKVAGGEPTALSDGVTDVTISETEGVKALDLLLMIDTTGSMGDELKFLQAELEDVVSRVAESSEQVLSIRISVNFYRDSTDKYIVRYYEFTENVSAAIGILKEQKAQGGGDYREAVHTAMDNAVVGHQWRDDAVKLMLMVLDAPPHKEEDIAGINARLRDTVLEAAEQGIRIIPVASSGVNKETEFLMRSYAVMTGGTYVFLTNHSGVGGDHIDPTVGGFNVEPLNECLIRIISEYCGLEYKVPTQK